MAIVIDAGSYLCKAGFGGEDTPKVTFPAVVGRPRFSGFGPSSQRQEVYVGEEALMKRGVLSLTHPVEHGMIKSWDDMEALWHHTFYNELSVKPEEHSFLLTEAPLNTTINRERITQIMFEKFNVKALYVANQAVLSLLASNSTTGTVLDCGAGLSTSVTIHEGKAIRSSTRQTRLAGRALTDYLWKFLLDNGSSVGEGIDTARVIKEKLTYIALNYEEELKKSTANKDLERSFELPDGEMIKINKMRFGCPEALFKPSFVQMDCPGIHELVHNSISDSDAGIRDKLYSNVVISGGTTMFPGFGERLKKELSTLASSNKVNVATSPRQKYGAWSGGSIFTKRSDFASLCISKSEYQEHGATIVHSKCA